MYMRKEKLSESSVELGPCLCLFISMDGVFKGPEMVSVPLKVQELSKICIIFVKDQEFRKLFLCNFSV